MSDTLKAILILVLLVLFVFLAYIGINFIFIKTLSMLL